jgi:phosphoribosyl 1,2-cyclic phosphodiesterase
VLASSSAGNSIFVSAGRTRLLVDAGLNRKEIFARLRAIGEEPCHLDAILITHEHSDHVSALPVLLKPRKSAEESVRARVYATAATAAALDWNGTVAEVETFAAGTAFDLGAIRVQSFTIPHDASDPVGYTLTVGNLKLSIATDLGYLPDNVRWNLRQSQFILLESNHCPEMLKVGPYPWYLKQRILSRKGHLSNEAASEYIAAELPDETETLILGHLSEQNNTPWQADLVAQQALAERGRSPRLIVAEPRKQSQVFHL